MWWIGTRDWPIWAKLVLLVTLGSTFNMGAPATYRAYLQHQRDQADYAELLLARESHVLARCHSCGRHTYVGSATCVRCGAADPIPDAARALRSVRFSIWVGGAAITGAALTSVYLVVSYLIRVAS